MRTPLGSLVVIAAVFACGASWATVWYVDDDASPGGTGLAWESALQTIESAVAAADVYDEIWIAAGEYAIEPTDTLNLKPGLQLYGGFVGNELDRLSRSAENYAAISSFRGYSWEPMIEMAAGSRLDGLYLLGANAFYDGEGVRVPGGEADFANCRFSFSPVGVLLQNGIASFENCLFHRRETEQTNYSVGLGASGDSAINLLRCKFIGGSVTAACPASVENSEFFHQSVVSMSGSTGSIRECAFYDSRTFFSGQSASVSRCSFSRSAVHGWGDNLFIEGSTFTDCAPPDAKSYSNAPLSFQGQYLTVADSDFSGNSGWNGGAIALVETRADFRNCSFADNYSSGKGGALYCDLACVALENCLFSNNFSEEPGAAVYLDNVSELQVTNSTIWGCEAAFGGAIQADHGSQALLTNSIAWACLPEPLATNGILASVDALYSCIEGGWPGTGNLDKTPGFTNPESGDFRLLWGSPCIDAGTFEGAPDSDLLGKPRPQLAGIDMGAFEFVIIDNDLDGMDDDWESYYGLDPNDPSDADEDADGDGVTNAQEAAIRNNPTDPDDCRDEYFVAPSGNDTEGDGSESTPWATIGKAMAHARGFSAYKPVTINAAAGLYQEQVIFAPNITLAGAGAGETKISYFDITEDEHFVVIGAEGAELKDCTVQVEGQYSASFSLIKIEDISMEVKDITFDGDDNLYSLGALIVGTGSSDTEITGCTFRRLYFGVQAVNTAANIADCAFSGIRGDAIFVRLPDVKKYGETIYTPLLGDAAQPGATGNNTFQNVMGNFVLNMNSATTLAENNDWGVYTDSEIAAKMAGPVDFKPYVGKIIDDNSGCFAVDQKATGARSGADAVLMLTLAALLVLGSRRK